jgi:hypothetical protein
MIRGQRIEDILQRWRDRALMLPSGGERPYRRAGSGVALLTVALLLLVGCPAKQRLKMHAGPEMPPSETATVTGQFKRWDWSTMGSGLMVTLEAVDEVPVPGQGRIRDDIYSRQTEAIITAGLHSVDIQFWSPSDDPEQHMRSTLKSVKPFRVVFNAEAGHDYEIRVARAAGETRAPRYGGYEKWVAWVVDLKTGESVSLPKAEIGGSEATPPNR